jgi:hypothetical protein
MAVFKHMIELVGRPGRRSAAIQWQGWTAAAAAQWHGWCDDSRSSR